MMRIGIVLPALPAYSETFFNNKIEGLRREGHHVIVFAQNRSGARATVYPVSFAPNLSGNIWVRMYQSGLAILRLVLFSLSGTVRFWNLERIEGATPVMAFKRLVMNSHILSQKLDWLHFGFATMGIDRENVGKAIGAKVALSFRGYDISIYPLRYPGCYQRLWKKTDKVHTISDDLLEQAYTFGLPSGIRVKKITPAIEAAKFYVPSRSFFSDQTIHILTVGRLHWKKGFEYTLSAIAKVKAGGFRVQYTIVGEGAERERLVYAAHQLGLSEDVHFIGKMKHNEIPDLMASNDIYIQYSIQEGFCNAVLEAQAAGMLCVVSDAEGLSENVLHGTTGWVVPKRNPALLAQQIIGVASGAPEELGLVSSAAANRVAEEFTLQKQRAQFNEFYTESVI